MVDKLELTKLGSGCNGGHCPTLYKDQKGRIFVQGTKVSEQVREELGIPSQEEIVELTSELINLLISDQIKN